jgi:tRNA pseudouridine13 synthase
VSEPLPFVTAGLPGSGGTLKATPEDFRVDELPAYLPAGSGPHLYLRIEKRGRNTREVVKELAARLSVSDRDVGVAGLKDRHAVTTQWLSFPVARDPDPASLAGEGLTVLEASRHQNKLRTGHVRGNRFTLVVRGGDLVRAQVCAGALGRTGLPNFFGPQRFGRDGQNASLGKALLLPSPPPEARRAARDRFLRRFAISAYQSLLFNRWLTERLRDGLFAAALPGDVLKKLDTGGLFLCQDPATDGERIGRFEVSPAGPMFGHELKAAEAEPAAREARLLAEEGLTLADFARGGDEAAGTRRAARLPVALALEPHPAGYLVRFDLPRGAYATVVLRELMKDEAALPDDEA